MNEIWRNEKCEQFKKENGVARFADRQAVLCN
jgi:hypothetical protein